MKTLFQIDEIIDSPSKLAILRVLASKRGFKTTGSEIAKLSGYSVPSTHEALKDLHSHNVLNFELIGKQHIYSLNEDDRTVKKIIRPIFKIEKGYKLEIANFLLGQIEAGKIKTKIVSLILYGSVQTKTTTERSDVDIAIVVKRTTDIKAVQEVFISTIMPAFRAYFGTNIDPYIKSAHDFQQRVKKSLPPVSTLMKSYSVMYGKEPLEI